VFKCASEMFLSSASAVVKQSQEKSVEAHDKPVKSKCFIQR